MHLIAYMSQNWATHFSSLPVFQYVILTTNEWEICSVETFLVPLFENSDSKLARFRSSKCSNATLTKDFERTLQLFT